jgi:chromosome segregation ATPase
MEKKKKPNKPIPKKININQKPIKSARITTKKYSSSKPKTSPENRLSDLENTLDLNIQILKTFYNSSKSKSVETLLTNESIIKDAIDNIKKKYLQKKQLFNQLKEKKSKSLIELQIYAEKKRKIEEMKDLYQDKIEENEEGLNGKEEMIKKVQKRLKEVEIYIHKLTLNMLDKRRQKYYQDFLINDFLDINNDLARQKDLLSKKVEQMRIDLQATIDENKLYKIKNNEEKNKTNDTTEIKIIDTKNANEEKIKKLTEKYENKIELVNSKINLLKNALEKMNQQFHLFNINKIIKKSNKSLNIYVGKKEENKINNNYFKKINVSKKNNERNSGKNRLDTEESINNRGKYNDDINNRINSFLDFSVLNNKEDENNISKEKFGIIKSSIWDVSAINDKDISIIEKKDEL